MGLIQGSGFLGFRAGFRVKGLWFVFVNVPVEMLSNSLLTAFSGPDRCLLSNTFFC